ncbi:hypothetical protein [Trinickia sp. Y13]|uniref:hypothetical protein n=1 Tax=Trinickia sp. Y13 TaxID=2917807 RepID=UPI002404C1CF|nr:hypothetical protein [Trinickia sp. Y13]MDG0027876.1 hypothetical protein [Trinickia sp. Y13]
MENHDTTNRDRLTDGAASTARRNSEAVARFGARLGVLCKFIDAVLPQLAAEQCTQIDRSFRQGVEELLARTEDVVMPPTYHTTLMEQTNVLLSALAQRGGTGR